MKRELPVTRPDQATILMATRNGAVYLAEQLDSLLRQEGADWRLIVSDDGSTDGTLDLLHRFRADHPDRSIVIMAGPQSGCAANFLSMLISDHVGAAPVLFCDQDDIWLPTRVSAALNSLAGVQGPAVYASRTLRIGPDGCPGALSPPRRFGARFGTALVQNSLAGNTIALNPAAIHLVRQTVGPSLNGGGVPFHDWWIYLMASGAGMTVIQDQTVRVLYRQHATNVLGAHRGGRATARRIGAILAGTYRRWIRQNLAALDANRHLLTPESCAQLDGFTALHGLPRLCRPLALRRLGIRRAETGGAAALAVLAVLGLV